MPSLIGVGTALADDPQLTVRRVAGPNPARVVIDPNGRLTPAARVLAEDGVRRLVITRDGHARSILPAGVEVVSACRNGRATRAGRRSCCISRERGFRRILIEGGSNTVSRFLAAGCLDRLHVDDRADDHRRRPVERQPSRRSSGSKQAIKAPMRAHILGDEVLLDCDLSAQRIGIGIAKKST